MLLNSKQVPTSSSRVHLKLANAMCTYKLYDFAHLFMLTFIFLSFIFIQIELDEMLNIEIQMLPRRVVGSSLIVHENGPNHVQVEINRWPMVIDHLACLFCSLAVEWTYTRAVAITEFSHSSGRILVLRALRTEICFE